LKKKITLSAFVIILNNYSYELSHKQNYYNEQQ